MPYDCQEAVSRPFFTILRALRFWISLQAQYDLAVAMRDVGKRIAREVERAA
jgi:hypothetical protein